MRLACIAIETQHHRMNANTRQITICCFLERWCCRRFSVAHRSCVRTYVRYIGWAFLHTIAAYARTHTNALARRSICFRIWEYILSVWQSESIYRQYECRWIALKRTYIYTALKDKVEANIENIYTYIFIYINIFYPRISAREPFSGPSQNCIHIYIAR